MIMTKIETIVFEFFDKFNIKGLEGYINRMKLRRMKNG